jgi:hypothetical protein
LHANLSPLAITIAKKETIGAIVFDSPPIRLALYDGLAHCSVKVCADGQARTCHHRPKDYSVDVGLPTGIAAANAVRHS